MQSTSINDRVERIKNSEEEINRFVQEYKPFIAACTEKIVGRYVRYGEDDELSIALMAFVEAIQSYSSAKGSFLPFTQNVIKRRLIDYYRKEKKHGNVVSIHECGPDEGEEWDLGDRESVDRFSLEQAAENRRLEINELKQELASWDITFSDLVETSPKHDKTRKLCREITAFILSQPEMVRTIKGKKYLPIAELEKHLNISRKKIERARKYIIAVVLIKSGDYRYLTDYIS